MQYLASVPVLFALRLRLQIVAVAILRISSREYFREECYASVVNGCQIAISLSVNPEWIRGRTAGQPLTDLVP